MRNKEITIKSLSKVADGLGGYTEEFSDIKVYGKIAYKKDKMVVTRANEVNTQKLVQMLVMYLTINHNDNETLYKLKKGDRYEMDRNKFSINLIEAYKNIFVVTLMEVFESED